jgi:tetratricopeptide (TPR) repeat protein
LLCAAWPVTFGTSDHKDHSVPFAPKLSRAACLSAAAAVVGAALTAGPLRAEDAGAYLAARAAAAAADYGVSAQYYDRLLKDQPDDADAREAEVVSLISLGKVDDAQAVLPPLLTGKDGSQVAVLAALAADARQGDFDKGLALLDAGNDAGKLVGGLYRAWALVGQGKMSEAAQAFDAVAKVDGLQGFAGYHRALALALVGDYEGAEAIFSGDFADIFNGTRRGVLAHVQILSQLERNADAVALLETSFGATLDPELDALRGRLKAGETLPFTAVTSARDGVAEIYYSVAQALQSDSVPGFALVHARLAQWIRPDNADATLLLAAILEAQDQYALAIEAYAMIGPDSPAFDAAEMGRAEAMVADGRSDAAIEVLEQLTRTHPDLPAAWSVLGDNLRREDRFEDAAKAYDKAIGLSGAPQPSDWGLWYARSVALERSGQWQKAEAGFREALKLSPDQPVVLNYLGYAYVEKRQNLTEALQMIEKAVAGRPDDGYITDSLGLAYYLLGRYEEAVTEMEKAVELMPSDPLLNDHLGDVYWAVGRAREAEFQWRRALNFGPADDLNLDRVRRKLAVGLDVVLKEEGAAPLHAEHAQN